MRAKQFITEAVFNIIFKAQLPDGKPYLKKFKITAPDKYTASDKIKEKYLIDDIDINSYLI
jgi:hypothetical protein